MHVHFVVLVCLCLVYKTVAVSRPSTMRFQNNQFTNVVVAFHDSIQEDKNLIDQLKDRMTKASQTLFKATRQRAYFKEIAILLPSSWSDDPAYGTPTSESIYQADVIITDNLRRKRSVHTRSYRGCGQQGVHVLLNKEFLTLPRASPYFNSPEKYFTHAFAQFRWGVFQEYAEEGESQFYISLTSGMPQAIRCTANMRGLVQKNDANHTICYSDINPNTGLFSEGCIWRPYPYRQPIKASMMDYQFINEIETFCDDNQTDRTTVHNYEAPSKHNRLCEHRSTWDVIQNSADFTGGINPPTSASVSQLTPTFRILKARTRKRRAIISMDASIIKKDGIEKTITNLGRLQREANTHSVPLSVSLVKNNRILEHRLEYPDDVKVLRSELLSSDTQFLSCHQMSQVQDSNADVISVCDHKISGIATDLVIPGETAGHTLLDKLRHSVFINPKSQNLLIMIRTEDYQIHPDESHTDVVHVDKLIDSELHFIFHYEQTSPVITIQSPSGILYSSENASLSDAIKEVLFMCQEEPGQWTYNIQSHNNQTVSLTVSATKIKDFDDLDIRLVLDKQESSVTYFQIYVDATHFHHPVIGLNVTVEIETPSHHKHWLQLYDNGAGADISRDDGVYSRYLTKLREPGHYHVTATIFGRQGQVFGKEESFEELSNNHGLGNVQKSITRTKINGTLQRHVGGQSIYVSTEDRKSLETKDDTPPCRITDLSVKKHVLYRNMFILKFTAPGDNMDSGKVAKYEVFIGEDMHGTSIQQFILYTNTLMQEGRGQIAREIYNATKVAMETEYILYSTKTALPIKSLIFGVVGVDHAGNRGRVSNIVIATAN